MYLSTCGLQADDPFMCLDFSLLFQEPSDSSDDIQKTTLSLVSALRAVLPDRQTNKHSRGDSGIILGRNAIVYTNISQKD